MCTHMGSINISIRKEAYEYLESLKSDNKSFSDVILGFKRESSPLDFFGALKDKKWKEAEERMRGLRTSLSERIHDRS